MLPFLIGLALLSTPTVARIWPASPATITTGNLSFVYGFAFAGTLTGDRGGFASITYDSNLDDGARLVAVIDTLWTSWGQSECALVSEDQDAGVGDAIQRFALPRTTENGTQTLTFGVRATDNEPHFWFFLIVGSPNCDVAFTSSKSIRYQVSFTQQDGELLSYDEYYCIWITAAFLAVNVVLLAVHIWVNCQFDADFCSLWMRSSTCHRCRPQGGDSGLSSSFSPAESSDSAEGLGLGAAFLPPTENAPTSDIAATRSAEFLAAEQAFHSLYETRSKTNYALFICFMQGFLSLALLLSVLYWGYAYSTGADLEGLVVGVYLFKGFGHVLLRHIAWLFAIGYRFLDQASTVFIPIAASSRSGRGVCFSAVKFCCCEDQRNLFLIIGYCLLASNAGFYCYVYWYIFTYDYNPDRFNDGASKTPVIWFNSISLASAVLFLCFWCKTRRCSRPPMCLKRSQRNLDVSKPEYYPIVLGFSFFLQFGVLSLSATFLTGPAAVDSQRFELLAQNGSLLLLQPIFIYFFLPAAVVFVPRPLLTSGLYRPSTRRHHHPSYSSRESTSSHLNVPTPPGEEQAEVDERLQIDSNSASGTRTPTSLAHVNRSLIVADTFRRGALPAP